jgi:hypothetical protein
MVVSAPNRAAHRFVLSGRPWVRVDVVWPRTMSVRPLVTESDGAAEYERKHHCDDQPHQHGEGYPECDHSASVKTKSEKTRK